MRKRRSGSGLASTCRKSGNGNLGSTPDLIASPQATPKVHVQPVAHNDSAADQQYGPPQNQPLYFALPEETSGGRTSHVSQESRLLFKHSSPALPSHMTLPDAPAVPGLPCASCSLLRSPSKPPIQGSCSRTLPANKVRRPCLCSLRKQALWLAPQSRAMHRSWSSPSIYVYLRRHASSVRAYGQVYRGIFPAQSTYNSCVPAHPFPERRVHDRARECVH